MAKELFFNKISFGKVDLLCQVYFLPDAVWLDVAVELSFSFNSQMNELAVNASSHLLAPSLVQI